MKIVAAAEQPFQCADICLVPRQPVEGLLGVLRAGGVHRTVRRAASGRNPALINVENAAFSRTVSSVGIQRGCARRAVHSIRTGTSLLSLHGRGKQTRPDDNEEKTCGEACHADTETRIYEIRKHAHQLGFTCLRFCVKRSTISSSTSSREISAGLPKSTA